MYHSVFYSKWGLVACLNLFYFSWGDSRITRVHEIPKAADRLLPDKNYNLESRILVNPLHDGMDDSEGCAPLGSPCGVIIYYSR